MKFLEKQMMGLLSRRTKSLQYQLHSIGQSYLEQPARTIKQSRGRLLKLWKNEKTIIIYLLQRQSGIQISLMICGASCLLIRVEKFLNTLRALATFLDKWSVILTLLGINLQQNSLFTGKDFTCEGSELSTRMAKKIALLHVMEWATSILLKKEKALLAPSKRCDIWIHYVFSLS